MVIQRLQIVMTMQYCNHTSAVQAQLYSTGWLSADRCGEGGTKFKGLGDRMVKMMEEDSKATVDDK